MENVYFPLLPPETSERFVNFLVKQNYNLDTRVRVGEYGGRVAIRDIRTRGWKHCAPEAREWRGLNRGAILSLCNEVLTPPHSWSGTEGLLSRVDESEELERLSAFWIQGQTEGADEIQCRKDEDTVKVYGEVCVSFFDISRKYIWKWTSSRRQFKLLLGIPQ